MLPPTFDPTGQRSYRSTHQFLVTRPIKVTPQELKAELLDRLKEHDLSFTLQLLVDIAESVEANCKDESESWFLDAWMIRSIIPHILH